MSASADHADAVLLAALRHRLRAPDAEAGIALLGKHITPHVTPTVLHVAVAAALLAGLIYDPVFLPAGALQCHWRLELTPAGADRARRLFRTLP